jgi:dimethylhistidine N-methyltransferase
MYAPAPGNELAKDVRAGLTRAGQKTLPCRYLYDELGSALFEAITYLPEYGLTRADARIIQAHAGDLAANLPSNLAVAELGSGSGTKTRPILEAIRGEGAAPAYYPIDVSRAALARCALELGSVARICPLEATYVHGLTQVAERRPRGQALLVLFLGSSIGNFEPDAAVDFLYSVRLCLDAGDALLLGIDLVKPKERLLAAYNDPTGVTAAFNLNLLGRINRELDANFDLRRFEHVAAYDRQAQRVEMHLRSREHQVVNVRRAGIVVEIAAGETICTEASYKYRPEQAGEMARRSGFRLAAQWINTEWPFAENLLVAA